jgi:hypothetical protein
MRLIDRALEIANAPHQGREVDEPNARVVVLPRFRYLIFSLKAKRFSAAKFV